jgi:hypothetical protein
MSKNEDLGDTEPRGISRRTVAIGAAWAVPVIALATASPAFAASNGVITVNGNGCKLPGSSSPIPKGNAFKMVATNTTNSSVSVTIGAVTLNGTPLANVKIVDLDTCSLLSNPFDVPANTTFSNLALLTSDAPNSQNGSLVVNYTVSGGSGQPATAQTGSLPPIQGSACEAFTTAQQNCIVSLT